MKTHHFHGFPIRETNGTFWVTINGLMESFQCITEARKACMRAAGTDKHKPYQVRRHTLVRVKLPNGTFRLMRIEN